MEEVGRGKQVGPPQSWFINGNFAIVWTASTASYFGTAVSSVALPLVALTTLGATTFEVGLISSAGLVAWLLLGLVAGAWVERRARRPILIGCDVVRGLVLASVPVAYFLDVLTLFHLVVTALMIGVFSVYSDIASQSILPAILRREELLAGNSKQQTSFAAAQTAGPALGGGFVQLITAPFALAVDAISYLASAFLLSRVRLKEEIALPAERPRMWPDVKAGLLYVVRDEIFRPLLLLAAGLNFAGAAVETLLVPFLFREVQASPVTIGLLVGIGGVGGLVGATLGPAFSRRVGGARTLWIAAVAGPVFALLMPFSFAGLGLLLFAVGFMVREACVAIVSLLARSFRQMTAPPEFLARITASIRFISWGTLPFGALLGGALGELLGTRTGLLISVAVLLLTPLPLLTISISRLQAAIDPKPGANPS